MYINVKYKVDGKIGYRIIFIILGIPLFINFYYFIPINIIIIYLLIKAVASYR